MGSWFRGSDTEVSTTALNRNICHVFRWTTLIQGREYGWVNKLVRLIAHITGSRHVETTVVSRWSYNDLTRSRDNSGWGTRDDDLVSEVEIITRLPKKSIHDFALVLKTRTRELIPSWCSHISKQMSNKIFSSNQGKIFWRKST